MSRDAAAAAWYAVRTKQYKEPLVARVLFDITGDIYLPRIKAKRRALGRFVERIEPLFPCYLFARFRLEEAYQRLMRKAGVVGLVCAGGEPCEIDQATIDTIKTRESNGLIVLEQQAFRSQQRVIITEGSFSGIEAVFDRYLSGVDRVALFLETVGGNNFRAIIRAEAISPVESFCSTQSARA